MLELSPQLFLALFMLFIPIIIFIGLISRKPTSLWVGAFALYLASILTALFFFGLYQIWPTLTLILIIPIALVLIFFSIFGILAMIIALFWNEKILLKHEKKSFANFLPLIVGSLLIALSLTNVLVNSSLFNDNKWITAPFSFILTVASYFALVFFFFSLTAIIYYLKPITGKVDYIIILGAGLIKDKVTPLLAARIDKGIALYEKQLKKGATPILIVSGGQGSDEVVSEAFAMKKYINEKYPHIKEISLLTEDQSTNTRENILFSEKIARKNGDTRSFKDRRVVLATNNYHLLRAGKIAAQLGLNMQGVGAKTRLFYLPTAFIREYIGYLFLSKKKHIWMIAIIFITTVGIELLAYLLTQLVN